MVKAGRPELGRLFLLLKLIVVAISGQAAKTLLLEKNDYLRRLFYFYYLGG